jgi:hypothetical protein
MDMIGLPEISIFGKYIYPKLIYAKQISNYRY